MEAKKSLHPSWESLETPIEQPACSGGVQGCASVKAMVTHTHALRVLPGSVGDAHPPNNHKVKSQVTMQRAAWESEPGTGPDLAWEAWRASWKRCFFR